MSTVDPRAVRVEVGKCGLLFRSGIEVSKKQNVSSPLTRKYSVLWEASEIERERARFQTSRARVSSRAVLFHSSHHSAYMCIKVS